ncbi:mechanosensitive ion channel family protein [Agromyces aerolatus]|uniref:mechanosensitive ion channel family protein n=1 Tax=Agromyces sp. LY-1074 TaxID=3074080 RepID=UPI0028642C97|nr:MULTISPECIES: mechanosensitive ion channel domain-containing protein [unclassified Agromyces]MDR5698748.1 mechanosensitive ion channel [Agromyces sp. LY-1074]MDR5705042.1 mechanosensitive ion channel [Agromyces sp. LY-1358]
MTPTWQSWLMLGISLVAVVVAIVAVSALASLIVRAAARGREWGGLLVQRLRWPFRTVIAVVGVWIAVAISFPAAEWRPGVDHAFLIAVIAVGAWLVCQLFLFLTDLGMRRYRVDVADNRLARRARTQLAIVRRLVVVIVIVIAVGVILFTFESVRALGASVLASAGIASIVAGLAAQSVLANLFAGIQLAFSDAIRVDDVVVVEGEWGRIEEITLNYVVVGIWDDRRLVLPCTYFTSQPFENWTRTTSELLGSVELDLDWRVSPGEMRDELDRILERTDLWDGRAKVLQVTDAVGGLVRVRVLLTAADAGTLFDLRCFVREELVHWVQRAHPESAPAQRVLVHEGAAATDASGGTRGITDLEPEERHTVHDAEPERAAEAPAAAGDGGRSGLFTGTPEAEARGRQFTQAIPIVRSADPDGADPEEPLDEPTLTTEASVLGTDPSRDPDPR